MSAYGDHCKRENRAACGRRLSAALRKAVLSAALLGGAVFQASAASQGIPFGGTVSDSSICTILVTQTGILGVSADSRVLSSKLAGGRPGIATVTSGRNYFVSAATYPFFTSSPPGGSTNTTFQALFSGLDISRGRTFAERDGSIAERLRGGVSITRITTNLVATRTGSSFPGGNYTSEVVLRCE